MNAPRILWRALPVISAFGLAGLAATLLLGFEEPNAALLALSAVALLIPLLVPFVHLAVTKELSREEKRAWLRAMTGRRAPWAWSAYLSCADRDERVRWLYTEAAGARHGEPRRP